jgi:hypothetical protein
MPESLPKREPNAGLVQLEEIRAICPVFGQKYVAGIMENDG